MSKLDDKIINKVYNFETKRTGKNVLLTAILFVVVIFSVITAFQIMLEEVLAEKSLDMLDIFQEDIEVIKMYYGEALHVIYDSVPKFHLIIFISGSIIILFLLILTIFNFSRIRNRIRSIISYRERAHKI